MADPGDRYEAALAARAYDAAFQVRACVQAAAAAAVDRGSPCPAQVVLDLRDARRAEAFARRPDVLADRALTARIAAARNNPDLKWK